MIVITCLDQKNGMMFNHRRQSQDSVLREHVAKLVANVPLWMNHYSASQFDTESIPNLNISLLPLWSSSLSIAIGSREYSPKTDRVNHGEELLHFDNDCHPTIRRNNYGV